MRLTWFLLLAVGLMPFVNAAKILAIFASPEKSHWAVGEGIIKALCRAGHQVTTISAFPGSKYPPECSSLVRHIHLTGLHDKFLELLPENLQMPLPPFLLSLAISYMGTVHFDATLSHESVQQFLAESPPPEFDLVVVESFSNEAFFAFAEHFNAPLIAVSTTLNTLWLNQAISNVEPWSFVANQLVKSEAHMTFWNRLVNVLTNLFELVVQKTFSNPQANVLIKKHFPANKKTLQEIMRDDVCLALLNTHFTIITPRPYVPNMIEIGGINIDPELEKLPEDFQQFLDSAEDGVIVFSMGSIFQASNLREDQRQAFISVFSRLKQKIVWRYNLPDADQLPKNILAREWLPQKEVLAHPNVKLFITHGGMLGTTEGFYHGVPMIGIPIFGDQPVNVARTVQQGFAVELDKSNLTEQAVSWAINEVLGNPKYSERVKELSSAYHDQPMTPQQAVVYWSEYVMKHKCARFMQNAGHKMNVIEYHNLDVWSLLVAFWVGSLYIVIRWVLKKCGRRSNVHEGETLTKKGQ